MRAIEHKSVCKEALGFYPVATLGLAATLAGCVYEAPGYAYNPYEPAVTTPEPPAYDGMYGPYRPYIYYHP